MSRASEGGEGADAGCATGACAEADASVAAFVGVLGPGTVDTPRLHLRPLGPADEALFVRLYTDPELMRHIAPPLSPDDARRGFRGACNQARRHPGRTPWWVIHERAAVTDVGVFGLVVRDGEVEVGTMLLPQGQGRGLGGEAIATVARHLFAGGCRTPLLIRHGPGNAATAAMAHRLGLVRSAADCAETGQWRWRLDPPGCPAATGHVAVMAM